ncbi:DUF3124 domain-containing protein [Paraliomyxa miuraensis]|uniref:DUF3124 domain-containing protein n=1 Tax=Paraliomyxa miuraensis TaxID=376150 RepID=UPI0022559519|nr:DUF3124 domain-containing protein [Paraliomyxa miuraensis]MCX4246153.1 DUF3124 domain-containing protein [Paraliomyxa miuraensis]
MFAPKRSPWSLPWLAGSLVLACGGDPPERPPELVGPRNLVPVEASATPRVVRESVYVPIYSSLYVSDNVAPVSLAATLSLRNTSEDLPVYIDAVEYYDSDGKLLQDMLPAPSRLGPMMTAEFFISRFDRSGGSGANFLVRWSADEPGHGLLVEAVQQGRDGNAGISFVTQGKLIKPK